MKNEVWAGLSKYSRLITHFDNLTCRTLPPRTSQSARRRSPRSARSDRQEDRTDQGVDSAASSSTGPLLPMLRELSTDPESGMLGYELLFGPGGPCGVQYWSSVDKLYPYASSPSQEHRPAWTRFNKMARKAPGAVGIWHETSLVDRAESVYVSTKPKGP